MANETQEAAWSYSALNRFLTCGKQYYHLNVLKDYREEKSEQLLWGDRVHKYLGDGLMGVSQTTDRDSELRHLYEPLLDRFRQTKGEIRTEQQVALTRNLVPTSWFSRDVWVRGIFDAIWIDGDIARIVDWKTGKRKVDSNQLLLSALLIFAQYPHVNRVNTAFVWLQSGKMDVAKYHRKDLTKLWQEILPDVRRLQYAHKTQTWIPKPSGLCKGWCPVRKCSFWDGIKTEEIKEHAV